MMFNVKLKSLFPVRECGEPSPKCASITHFNLPTKKVQERQEGMRFLISFTWWIIIDQIGTWRTWLAILLPPSIMRRCDKPHPSNLTASFKAMGKVILSVYQHSVFQISLYTLREPEIKYGGVCQECSVPQYSRDIYWLPAVLQLYTGLSSI